MPGPTGICWNGTATQGASLLEAITRNCACVIDADGVRAMTCGAHQLLLDQRALDHLAFIGAVEGTPGRGRISGSEFSVDDTPWSTPRAA